MSETKYLIELIKAGVADHTVVLAFKFIGDHDGYSSPVNVPVNDLKMNFDFEYQPSGASYFTSVNLGEISMADFATLNNYYISIPFDLPSNFAVGSSVMLRLTFTGPSAESYEINWTYEGGGILTSNQMSFTVPYAEVPFAHLTTRFTYCPGGECVTLGNN